MNAPPLILLVDDLAIVRIPLRSLLETHGFRVAEAADGQEALRLIPDLRPDAVVSDINMPVMDGCTFCIQLASDDRFLSLPVVLMTGHSWDLLDQARLALGSRCDVIAKPFRIIELEKKLWRLLGMFRVVDTGDVS